METHAIDQKVESGIDMAIAPARNGSHGIGLASRTSNQAFDLSESLRRKLANRASATNIHAGEPVVRDGTSAARHIRFESNFFLNADHQSLSAWARRTGGPE